MNNFRTIKIKLGKMGKCKKGFTLIEMVIVVAILGAVASIGIIKYGDTQKTAKINADYATASSIATAANLALNNNVAHSAINLAKLKTDGYLVSTPKPQSITGTFEVKVMADGYIQVTGGSGESSTVFYPKGEAKI